MSEDGYIFKFSRGQSVYHQEQVYYVGTVLGYIQTLDKKWHCCVEAFSGTVYMSFQEELHPTKELPKLMPSSK